MSDRGNAVGSGGHGYVTPGESYYPSPQFATSGPPVRRADVGAGLLLILAGLADGVSLVLRWFAGDAGPTGFDIVRTPFDTGLGDSEIISSGLWKPLAVLFGGALLFILGLLMLIRARTHRLLGLVALLVSLGAGAGAVLLLADFGWEPRFFSIGFWVGCGVAVLGLIGSLKALFTRAR
jgi:hypothetical protein